MNLNTAVIFDKIVFILCYLSGAFNRPTLLFHADVVGFFPDSPKDKSVNQPALCGGMYPLD
jgi:hypothetical protein